MKADILQRLGLRKEDKLEFENHKMMSGREIFSLPFIYLFILLKLLTFVSYCDILNVSQCNVSH